MKQSDDPGQPSSALDADTPLGMPLQTPCVSASTFGISPDDSDPDVEAVLAKYDWYINLVAWQIVNGNTLFVRPEVLDLLVDDLVQNSRIKLWQALTKGITILSMKGLIRRIVHNEYINLVRQHKPALPLLIDEFGEVGQGKPIVGQSEDLDAPEDIVERETMITELLEKVITDLLKMPHSQMEAMICCLKETVEDVSQLVVLFRKHGIEIEEISWPEEKRNQIRLKASLSPARKKMRSMRTPVCA